MVLGIAVTNVLAALVSVVTALSGVYNQLARGPVGVLAVVGIGFAFAGRKADVVLRAN